MPETTQPSSLSPACINTSSTKATPLLHRDPPSHPATFSSKLDTPHPLLPPSTPNTDTITPATDDHHARMNSFKKQLQKLEEDVAEMKGLMEEKEKGLEGIRWEVEAQGDDMEEVEDRSARTLRGLRRLRRMNGR